MSGSPRPHGRALARRTVSLTASVLICAGALTACGGSGSGQDAAGAGHHDAGAFPASVRSTFGTAKIPKAPKRVVALGWSDQDVLLSLGIKPVAVVKTEDGFRHGVGPWAQKALGASRPKVLDTADGYPVEKIAALHPDLIVGVQSGITKSDYGKLRHVAPTVAYPKGRVAYGTPWEQQTRLIGKAVGLSKEADQAVDKVKRGLAADRRKYPALKGKTFSYLYPQTTNGRVVLYRDERTKVLGAAGLKLDPVVDKGQKMNTFANSLSTENLDKVRSDALLVWYNSASDRHKLESDPVFKKLPSVKRGAYVPLGRTMAQATSAPSVLSIPWSMGKVLPKLEKSVK